MTDQTELKPCPFCGGDADGTIIVGGYVVYCTDCNPDYSVEQGGRTKSEAITAWNTRADPWQTIETALEQCSNCKCYKVSEKNKVFDIGLCRLHPPMDNFEWLGTAGQFTRVKQTDWCGEYLPTPPQAKGGEG